MCLSRKSGEVIIAGEGANRIEIRVLEIRSGEKRVILGFDADKSVPIHRKEVADAIEREKRG